ncbi:hypothetical protein [Polyangium fumosum]|uniref:Uncharacterized protein n=1 Tax=Polyangium fumosum TaxID=889272 RepID=A0A4U1J4P3_9BACT|nr:hypothetical protein [Polyangium fumosum]TKD02216.1 hypothetical protein E8A74_29010 [Polyangium fumosum]
MRSSPAPLLATLLLVLSACTTIPRINTSPDTPTLTEPKRTLVLGEVSRGDTRSPDHSGGSTCKNGGRTGQDLDHLYGFEVHETASYRFEFVPASFEGVIQIQKKHKAGPGHFGIGCKAARAGNKATLSLPLEPDFYWVIVDGNLWDEAGTYTLRVDRDTSKTAVIRPEEPALVAPLCARAPLVRPGERTYGTFESKSGGARASCGLLGGESVHRLSLAAPTRIRLRAAAHFQLALEIRSGCHEKPVVCTRADAGHYEVEVTTDLPAGDHYVVLDSTRLGPPNTNGSHLDEARLTGAYVIDAEEVGP